MNLQFPRHTNTYKNSNSQPKTHRFAKPKRKLADKILLCTIAGLLMAIGILCSLIAREASPIQYELVNDDLSQQTQEDFWASEEAEEETLATTVEEKAKMAVTVTKVNIRSIDSEDGMVLDTVEADNSYPFIEISSNGWTKIEYDGQEAYINSAYVKLVDAE